MTGSYNNFFRVFDRTTKRDLTLEAARDIAKPKTLLKPRKVSTFMRSCFIHKSHSRILYIDSEVLMTRILMFAIA